MTLKEIDPQMESAESHYLWVFWILWRVVSYNQVDSFFGVEYSMEIFETTIIWICQKRNFLDLLELNP